MTTVTNNETSTADCAGSAAPSDHVTLSLSDAAVCACAVVDPFNVDFGATDTAAFTDAVEQIIGFNDSATAAAAASAAINNVTGETRTETAVASDSAELSFANDTTDTADASDTAIFTVDSFASSTAAATDTPSLAPVAGLSLAETANATATAVIVVELDVTDTADGSDSTAVVLDIGVTDGGVAAAAEGVSTSVDFETSSTAAATDAMIAQTVAVYAVVSSAIARAMASLDSSTAFWSNSESDAAATWSNVPFNSFAMHEGQLYAAGPGGVYVFGADDDVGSDIVASLTSDAMDFGTDLRKRYPSAYIAGALPSPMRVTITTEHATGAYDTITQTTTGATNHRAILGRGMTGRYARATLTNIDGSDFDVKSVEIAVHNLHRRV